MGILVYILFATFLAILIVSLSYFLVTQSPETEKLSTYECGFEPYEDSRNKFSVYIVAILSYYLILKLFFCYLVFPLHS
jgi:NADH-quinone oxidoreductase subunit A